jgi:hypothetical protein
VAALFFAVRLTVFTIYWSDPAHRDQAVEGWMTPGYVARSWDVDPEVIRAALPPPPDGTPDRRPTLDAIAGRGRPPPRPDRAGRGRHRRGPYRMTETILALVPVYGLALIALATFLSCLALPIPSSLIMLSAGGFGAGGRPRPVAGRGRRAGGPWRGISSATGSGSSASGRSRGAGCRRNAPR